MAAQSMLKKYSVEFQTGSAIAQALAVVLGIGFAIYQSYFNADTLYLQRYDHTVALIQEYKTNAITEGFFALKNYGQESKQEYTPDGKAAFTTGEELKLFSAISPYTAMLEKIRICLSHHACDGEMIQQTICHDVIEGAAYISSKLLRVNIKVREQEDAAMRFHVYPVYELAAYCYRQNPHVVVTVNKNSVIENQIPQ